MYILVHCSGDGIASWECSPWGPYAQLLAPGWQPALIGDDARLRYTARGVVRLAQGPMNVITVVAGAEALVIGGVEAAPGIMAAGDAAQAANGYLAAAAENSIAWENIYDFTKGVANPRAFPVTPGGVLGGFSGAILRALLGQ